MGLQPLQPVGMGCRMQIIAFCLAAQVSVTGPAAAAKMQVLVDVYVNVKAQTNRPQTETLHDRPVR